MSKVAHGRVLVSQSGAESYRGQSVVVDSCSSWSVGLIVVVSRRDKSFFRGQSFFLAIVVSLLRDQSFFVDGVYILWWLCTRIY